MPFPKVRMRPAWEFVGEYLRSISFCEPRMFQEEGRCGWAQERPADPSLGLGCRMADHGLWVGLTYGQDPSSAWKAAVTVAERGMHEGVEKLRAGTDAWWARYWRTVPRLQIPNERLDFLYRYGMYKFAGLTSPDGGVPAGLQGAWIEEWQMPPWQGDYHFNINVQMCYWPA
jgi:hypothetical protein